MNPTNCTGEGASVTLSTKSDHLKSPVPVWAGFRFLDDAEVVDLLRRRLGKSEEEVQSHLKSFANAAGST